MLYLGIGIFSLALRIFAKSCIKTGKFKNWQARVFDFNKP
jgi:ribosomal protein S21